MARYINADALIRKIQGNQKFWMQNIPSKRRTVVDLMLLNMINDIPTADVREEVYGAWFNTTHGLECSNCRTFCTFNSRGYNYCPWCGARMGKGGEVSG